MDRERGPRPVVVPMFLYAVAPLTLLNLHMAKSSSRPLLRTVVMTTGREVARGLEAVAWPSFLACLATKYPSWTLLWTVVKATDREVVRGLGKVLGQGDGVSNRPLDLVELSSSMSYTQG
ncbi:hypothetical protein H5410_051256 [Solanum commersonii]|uniref:Uncharacterized protein n=1 Tax=Solanum commersonii TaxID=4109 RepID=A0A9J5WZH3_SOLCO|nr:hypothetical protein H5410_051256 [Solanum commersonii]